ncbi:MAG: NAD(P)H-dependent flavin oxidoreductase [Bdellovibrionales bacterium]
MREIPTSFTKMMKCQLPIIGAPMFLVSNVEMVVAVSEAGGIGAFPALNYRPIEEYRTALKEMKARTKKPIGVNVIVNKSNTRQGEDLKHALDAGVDLFITSLGSPKEVIKEAHKNGAKVICDVTNLDHAKKVQDLGGDGVIAVGSGAGGHAGPISPIVLIPWLAKNLEIPVIAAGGVSDGQTMAAMLALGAGAVSIGTRFIASKEAQVDQAYKDAILKSTPEDIVMTMRVSGVPASVIRTPYIDKVGTELPWVIDFLQKNSKTKKYMQALIHLMGAKQLEQAALKPTWKTVWSAGQGVGLIDEILSCNEIMEMLVQGYFQTIKKLPT